MVLTFFHAHAALYLLKSCNLIKCGLKVTSFFHHPVGFCTDHCTFLNCPSVSCNLIKYGGLKYKVALGYYVMYRVLTCTVHSLPHMDIIAALFGPNSLTVGKFFIIPPGILYRPKFKYLLLCLTVDSCKAVGERWE